MNCPNCGATMGEPLDEWGPHVCPDCTLAGPRDVLECVADALSMREAVKERLTSHAACVPIADVRDLLEQCERIAARAPAGVNVTSDVLDVLAWFVVARQAAAKGGEHG